MQRGEEFREEEGVEATSFLRMCVFVCIRVSTTHQSSVSPRQTSFLCVHTDDIRGNIY